MTENLKGVKKILNNEIIKEQGGGAWLTTDPSGHSKSGYLLFRNKDSWELGTWEDEKWQNHAKFFHNLVKKENVRYWGIEGSGRMLKGWGDINKQGSYFMAKSYFDLLNCFGALMYIGEIEEIETTEILNASVGQWEKKIKEKEPNAIPGLKYGKVRKFTEHYSKKGILVPTWTFKNNIINDHEKDAVIIFYLHYVNKNNNIWPFKDE